MKNDFNRWGRFWLLNHNFHRLDGPAIEYEEDGHKEYWLNGTFYDRENWEKYVKRYISPKKSPKQVSRAEVNV